MTPGSWTMVYDEGFEVSRPSQNATYRAFSYYECAEGGGSCGGKSDAENEQGETPGYNSKCGRTLIGWYAFEYWFAAPDSHLRRSHDLFYLKTDFFFCNALRMLHVLDCLIKRARPCFLVL